MQLAWIASMSVALGNPSEGPQVYRWEGARVSESLHPVRHHPMAEWHQAMSLAMAGPQASPVFRSAASRMDCYWRLSTTGSPPALTEDFEQVVLDQALLGASLGLEATVRHTLDRGEEVAIIRRVVRTATGPGVEWTGGAEGGSLRANEPNRRGRMAMVDLESGTDPTALAFRPPPPPQFRMGSGLRLVPDNDADLLAEGMDVHTDPALSAYAHGSNLGLDQFRVELLWERPGMVGQDLGWQVALREGLHPVVAWVNSLHGELSGSLDSARSTLEWHPTQLSPWVLRTGMVYRPRADAPVRLEVAIQSRTRWTIPSSMEQWPLGQEPGAEGPTWPELPDRTPNELVDLTRSNAIRVAEN